MRVFILFVQEEMGKVGAILDKFGGSAALNEDGLKRLNRYVEFKAAAVPADGGYVAWAVL